MYNNFPNLNGNIYLSGRLNSILTPFAQMMLQRRMQKCIRWQATKIPPEISSSFPSDIFCIFYFKRTCVVDLNHMVQIYYRVDVFQTTNQTHNVHPLPPTYEWEITNPLMVVLLPI
uniref:Uncharacterized protein n=1 Tax=Lactuca sativa TaxID=4236 RepID=A0A9R1VKS9_LACSA|nr:hypothetical protein LSAT_V11C500234220 [Lactuca sativa]